MNALTNWPRPSKDLSNIISTQPSNCHRHRRFYQNRKRRNPYQQAYQQTMSGYFFPPRTSPPEDQAEEFDFSLTYSPQSSHITQDYQPYVPPPSVPGFFEQPMYHQRSLQSFPEFESQYAQQYQHQLYQPSQTSTWIANPPTVPSSDLPQQRALSSTYIPDIAVAGRSTVSTQSDHLSLAGRIETRETRSTSFTSIPESVGSYSQSDVSRSASPNASEMARWGFRTIDGSWSCSFPGCTSRSTFTRGCDLRKHYKRHTKTMFCRVEGCPQAKEGGFSSKKDRARHEAKHNPSVVCEWEGCDRLFSRVDNMKDHVRRVHRKVVVS